MANGKKKPKSHFLFYRCFLDDFHIPLYLKVPSKYEKMFIDGSVYDADQGARFINIQSEIKKK